MFLRSYPRNSKFLQIYYYESGTLTGRMTICKNFEETRGNVPPTFSKQSNIGVVVGESGGGATTATTATTSKHGDFGVVVGVRGGIARRPRRMG